jgi:hypothetical protein
MEPWRAVEHSQLRRYDSVTGLSLSLRTTIILREFSNIQADAHEKAYRELKTPEDQWGPEVAALVEKRRKEAQGWLDAVM